MGNGYPTRPDPKVSGNTRLNSTYEEPGRVWILPELFGSGMDNIHTQPVKKKKKKKQKTKNPKPLRLSPSLTLPLLSPHRHSLSLRALQIFASAHRHSLSLGALLTVTLSLSQSSAIDFSLDSSFSANQLGLP